MERTFTVRILEVLKSYFASHQLTQNFAGYKDLT